ncbi:MAG: hypothetical protein ABI376_10150 [Caulobacteraceae bacterium]
MTAKVSARICLMALIAVSALAAPGLEGFARSRKVVEAPPPPLPPAKPVGLPTALLADAAAYEAYLARTTAISTGFTDGGSVASALRTAAAYEPTALIRGAVAYGAVAALEDPTFVADVRAAGNSPENRRIIVGYIVANPAYAFQFKNADVAAGLAKEALGGAALRLYAEGKAIKQSAYQVQHQSWSKTDVADRPGRLAAVEASANAPIQPAGDRVPVLEAAASGTQPQALPFVAQPAKPPYTPLLARSMQIAAIAALGEAGDDAYDRLVALTDDGATHTCLHMAKLNLYQCLAVAKPNYEDIFCMGQHVMMDTGACLAKNAGVEMPAPPPAPPPVVAPAPAKHRRSAHR